MAHMKVILLVFVVASLLVKSTAFFKFHDNLVDPRFFMRSHFRTPNYFGRSLYNKPRSFSTRRQRYQPSFGRYHPWNPYYGQRQQPAAERLSPWRVEQQRSTPLQRYLAEVKRDLFHNQQHERITSGLGPKYEVHEAVEAQTPKPQQEKSIAFVPSSRVPVPSPPTPTEGNFHPNDKVPAVKSARSSNEDHKSDQSSGTKPAAENEVDLFVVDDEEAEWPSESKGRWASEGYVNTRGEFVRY